MMLRIEIYVLYCFSVSLLFVMASSKQCYWNSKNPYRYFSTITPYDDVRGDIRDVPPLEGCTPISLWALVRHGTRHPSARVTAAMHSAMAFKDTIVENYYEGRGDMCAQDITNLVDWQWDDSIDSTPSYLTPQGHQELLHLGQRVRDKFSPILGNLDSFQFRPTNEQRTKESAKAFVEGLEDAKFTIEEAIEEDNIIRPYKHCDRFEQQLKNSTHFDKEMNKLHETEDFKQMLASMRHRLDLPGLSAENITGMYYLCQFFRAYAVDRRSAWCSVFRDEDLRVLEYVEDLETYYSCGYGSPTSTSLGALPLRNLHENLEASANGSHSLTGYFSHDTMMALTFTALGLDRDYPEISGLEIDAKRKWRSSYKMAFASNLIVVLNECTTNDVITHKVQVFVNEAMVPLCSERACDLQEFREKLEPFKNSSLDFCKV